MDKDDQHSKMGEMDNAEKNLCAALEEPNSANLNFEPLIHRYRSACQSLILRDLEHSASKNVENKLWDAHVRVNGRFRSRLGYFRGLKGKRKPVEERKAAKSYLDFIKSSQRFYRGFIQELTSNFGGIHEIEAVARRFRSDAAAVAAEKRLEISPDLQHALLQSCHRTLIHLGDLSRYRESEIDAKKKQKNWGPALGYYDLAIAIYPVSGIPYNQLAIISKSDGDHARALYHLYRAQSAPEPPPTAFANLELEFKKIREASNRDHILLEPAEGNPLSKLQYLFPLLHSRCFDGMNLGDYEELESQMLQEFSTGLTQLSLETNFINRVVLSNVAADFTAGDRWQDAPDAVQNELAFKYFQRLNLRTFTTLLELIHVEFAHQSVRGSTDNLDVVSVLMRRLLPSLRYYQSWLLSRAALLSAHLGDANMHSLIRGFWTMYVKVISLMLSDPQLENLPQLEYLLEEDEEIIGFKPLQEGELQQKYFFPNYTSRKPKCHEQGVKRHHPNTESLCRIRDFMQDAIELASNEFIPIEFARDTRFFTLKAPFDGEDRPTSTVAHEMVTLQSEDASLPDAESTTDDAVSQGASVPLSHSATLNQMVDDLVGPERDNGAASSPSSRPPASSFASAPGNLVNETSYGIGHGTLTALDFVNKVRSWSPKSPPLEPSNPTLPSIMNSPFAPRPEEESMLTRSPVGKHRMPTHSPQLSQQHIPSHSMDSTISSMPDPTPFSEPRQHRTQLSAKDKVFGQLQQYGEDAENFNFDSSNFLVGSSFPYNARDCVTQATPPNGQG